ncbi:TPA: hypothetical protein SL445_003585 [Pseudomonas aeruginosa]|nr:hypothetical protein [Pseudomonas aeruginosa]
MAKFPLSMQKKHPYAESARTTHGNFADTPYTIRPYSAAGIPFRWMLREQVEGNKKWGVPSLKEILQLGYQAEREPDLTVNKGWEKDKKTWVQEGTNQRIILDTFFSVAKPDESLVFFYAKRTPLVEDARRVLIGVGRVKSVSAPIEYHYSGGQKPKDNISGYLWERNIEHSIRPRAMTRFFGEWNWAQLRSAAKRSRAAASWPTSTREEGAMRLSRRYPGIFSGWRRGGASGVCDAIARHHTSFRRREKDRRDSSWDRGLQAVGHALGESSATMGFCCFLRSRSSLHAELALPCWLQLEERAVSEECFPTMPGASAGRRCGRNGMKIHRKTGAPEQIPSAQGALGLMTCSLF